LFARIVSARKSAKQRSLGIDAKGVRDVRASFCPFAPFSGYVYM